MAILLPEMAARPADLPFLAQATHSRLMSRAESVVTDLSAWTLELPASFLAQSIPRLLEYALDILTVLVALPGFPPVFVEPALRCLAVEDPALSASALRFLISHFSESPPSADPELFPALLPALSACANVTVARISSFSVSPRTQTPRGPTPTRSSREPTIATRTIVNSIVVRARCCDLDGVAALRCHSRALRTLRERCTPRQPFAR
jgi:hypothetical protein